MRSLVRARAESAGLPLAPVLGEGIGGYAFAAAAGVLTAFSFSIDA